ncbi:MAG: sigma-70 family RNA polymerase sigma factor [Planctomycetes bacterium]|nr:sigma-70 family RNA polymerase sigma factor [Planctomycetota bacterium]MBI3846599.1 sigma-70 family RNA polymerase sigma factor [Planctomycetota bacterium]
MDTRMTDVSTQSLLEQVGWIRSLAHGLVRDASIEDDLVQDTLLKAIESPPRAAGSMRPWLATVVRNAARQWNRGERRRATRETTRTSPPSMPTPAELAADVEMHRVLAEVVLELQEPFRSTILLHYYEGLACAEIARRADISDGTVRWRLKRGLEELRAKLDVRHGGDRRAWCVALLPLLAAPPMAKSRATWRAPQQWLVPLGLVAAGVVTIVTVRALDPGTGGRTNVTEPITASRPSNAASIGLDTAGDSPTVTSLVPLPSVAPSTAARAAASSTSDGSAPSAAAAPAAVPSATVKARFVDANGAPVPGVQLRPTGIGAMRFQIPEGMPGIPRASSGADGRVTLVCVAPTEVLSMIAGKTEMSIYFQATGKGFGERGFDVLLSDGATVDLGDVVLRSGGRIVGRVLDAAGRGIRYAQVSLAPPTPPSSDKRVGPATLMGSAFVSTAEDGSFAIDGVREGFTRLWATTDSKWWAASEPIDVSATGEAQSITLTLDEPARKLLSLSGRVITPDGVAAGSIRLSMVVPEDANGQASLLTATTGDGCFEFTLPNRDIEAVANLRGDVIAVDDAGRFGIAAVLGASFGGDPIVVRLPGRRDVELVVQDPDGTAVDAFRLETVLPLTHREERIDGVDGRSGHAVVRIPPMRFAVRVSAPGHEARTLGPFDGDSAPEKIECVLATQPGVRGRVTAQGRALAGASVSVHDAERANDVGWSDNRCHRIGDLFAPTARTDASGAFRIDLQRAGDFIVRAEAPGFAPIDIGPLHLEPRSGFRDLDIAMNQGGSIAGHVLVHAGRSPLGVIVGVKRDGEIFDSCEVGPEGAFRFDRIPPGRWDVIPADALPWRGNDSSGATECDVIDEHETAHDLDLRAEVPCALEGSLLIDRVPPGPWSVVLFAVHGESIDERIVAWAGLRSDGRFEVEAPKPGRYVLLLEGTARDVSSVWIQRTVDLDSTASTMALAVSTGSVEGNGGPPATRVACMSQLADGTLFVTQSVVDAAGAFRFAVAPAGPARIVRCPEGARLSDAAKWETIREVVVTTGETTRVDLR